MTATTDAGVLPVTWHTHTDRSVRAAVGRNVPWWKFRERMIEEVAFLADTFWHMRGVPASESVDGMVIRVDGWRVGVVDAKGLDYVDEGDRGMLIDFVWPDTFESGGAVTVGQVVTAMRHEREILSD